MGRTTPTGAIGRANAAVEAAAVLHRMRSDGRTTATPAERAALREFPGWGPMAPSFAPKTETWQNVADKLGDLLPKRDLETAELGTYTAFYTPERIAHLMWQLMQDLGYQPGTAEKPGGIVLEPGCGGGVFIGAAPEHTPMIGVDRDPTAAAITQALYPQAQIITSPLEAARLEGGYAAAIGNVPFGKVPVHDPTAPGPARSSVHNYFIWRALREVAPGGLVVLLTSRYTMDSASPYARHTFADLADFIGAVRLPNGALEGGTQALADIVVLRRRPVGWRHEDSTADLWTESRAFAASVSVNKYWDTNPDMVLGTMREGQTDRFGLTLAVDPDRSSPIEDQISGAFTRIVEFARERDLLWRAAPDPASVPISTAGVVSKEGWHEGSIRKVGGQVVRVVDGKLKPVTRVTNELLQLLALRDCAVRLLELEADHDLPDSAIDSARAATMDAYVTYVKRFGAINRSTVVEDTAKSENARLPVPRKQRGGKAFLDELTAIVDEALDALPSDDFGVQDPEPVTYKLVTPQLGGFRTDPDFQVVAALEEYDDDTGEHTKLYRFSPNDYKEIVAVFRGPHPETGEPLSATGMAWMAGLLEHAAAATAIRTTGTAENTGTSTGPIGLCAPTCSRQNGDCIGGRGTRAPAGLVAAGLDLDHLAVLQLVIKRHEVVVHLADVDASLGPRPQARCQVRGGIDGIHRDAERPHHDVRRAAVVVVEADVIHVDAIHVVVLRDRLHDGVRSPLVDLLLERYRVTWSRHRQAPCGSGAADAGWLAGTERESACQMPRSVASTACHCLRSSAS